jgi:hypothetical protein
MQTWAPAGKCPIHLNPNPFQILSTQALRKIAILLVRVVTICLLPQRKRPDFFCRFVRVPHVNKHISQKKPIGFLVLDMSDCYTCSFPEFIPFCSSLFYFSTFKDFNTVAQA